MNKKLLFAAMVALPISLLITGCHSSGSGSTTDDTSTSSTSASTTDGSSTGNATATSAGTAGSATTTTSMAPPKQTTKMVPAPKMSMVSYAQVQTILNKHCIGCHRAVNPVAGINLTTYKAIAAKKLFVAGDAAKSVLYEAVTGTHGMDRMPKRMPPLAQKDIDSIKTWIASGAKSS